MKFTANDPGLTSYITATSRYKMLSVEEEYRLSNRWRDDKDEKALEKLINPYLRLVVKVAMGYRGYGLPIEDIIAEGNMGLMEAAKRFDPSKGFRLATYATWWIRAEIQEYVIKTWSVVKMGSSGNQRRLFFGLRRARAQIVGIEQGNAKYLSPQAVTALSKHLGIKESEVQSTAMHMMGDHSLNAPIHVDGEVADEYQDILPDHRESPEDAVIDKDLEVQYKNAVFHAMEKLSPRERRVIEMRRLAEVPATLTVLSDEFGVSRERVRQVENKALEKMRGQLKRNHFQPSFA